MHSRLGPAAIVLIAFILSPLRGWAFADNNVRVDRFHWMHVQTEHFDIYYDKENAALIPGIARHLEGAWTEVGKTLRYQVPERTPFFLYVDHNKFEQTNIVPIDEGTGGVTEAFKNRLLIFNDGSEEWLRHVVYHEFGHVVQFNVLYGGFWKSVRLLKSPFYPLWFMEGMAEYGAGAIDQGETDLVIRDAVANHQVPSLTELQGFAHLKPNQVTLGYKTGESAMEFLADEYGQERVHDLLVKMKDHFDISSALEEMLGLDLDRFDFRFQEWLQDRYADEIRGTVPPSAYGPKLTASDGIPQFNEAPAVAKDGRTIYFMSDRGGPVQVYAYDVATKTSRPLIDLKWNSFEYLETRGRALSLSPDGRWLAFAGEKRQRDYLYLYDLKRRRLKRVKLPFTQIRTPVFSPTDDDRLVCVGLVNGYNDLYLVNRAGRVVDRLTDTPQDERDPTFTPDGQSIVFSGEMIGEDGDYAGRDLFRLRLSDKTRETLTDLPGAEGEPEVLGDGSILFVRDQDDKGRQGYNLYRLRPSTTSIEQLTNVTGGAFSPRYSPALGAVIYVGFQGGEKHLYRGDFKIEPDISAAPPAATVVASTAAALDDEDIFAAAPAKKVTRAPLTWPANNDSPLFKSGAEPYHFRGSTDLFLPFFLYSTLDGLVLADIWQWSDLLGNHQLQQQLEFASGSDYIDLSAFYTYARFRPEFTIGAREQRYYMDFEQQEQRKETDAIAMVTYPLDRINSVSAGIGVTQRKDTFLDFAQPDDEIADRFYLAAFHHDTVTGRYLVPTKGRRLDLFYQSGVGVAGGDQHYKSGGVEAAQYVTLPRESTLASHFFYSRSVGPQPQDFRLGGTDRLRGFSSSDENKKTNVVITSAELRYRLRYLNARTKFLFPDFFFKAAYLIVFDDVGYGWDTRQERDPVTWNRLDNAAGLGLSWPTFILQSFQVNFTVQWAKRTTDGNDIWYVTLGPSF